MDKPTTLTTHSGKKLNIPDYNGQCITQIPDYITSILTSRNNHVKLHVPESTSLVPKERVLFFLVDGFGMSQWSRYQSNTSILQAISDYGNLSVIDTVFPSSTPVALTSIYSNGMTPRKHGLIDWWMYLSQTDSIVATLPFRAMGNKDADSLYLSGVSPEVLYSGETIFNALAHKHVSTTTFLNAAHKSTAYSKMVFNGSSIITYSSVTGLYAALASQMSEPTSKTELLYVYWSEIDEAGHIYGPESSEHALATSNFFSGLETFINEMDQDVARKTQIIISADHGQISVDPTKTFYLNDIDGLMELFDTGLQGKTILPWGGPREIFIKVKNQSVDTALNLLHAKIGSDADLITSLQAMRSGLFGDNSINHPDFMSRIGDIIILPKNNSLIWYRHPNGEPPTSLGQHGGLSNGEIKVPFATIAADRLQNALIENQCL